MMEMGIVNVYMYMDSWMSHAWSMSTALEIVSQARHIHSAVPIAPCMLYRGRDWCCGMEKVWLVRLKTSIYTTVYNCECMRLTLVSDVYTNHIKELATFTQLWLHHELFSLAKYLPMTFELKMQSLDCCLGCKTSFCSRHVTLHCVCSDADLWWETE